MITQNMKILEYMQTHGSITSLEAIQHIGCTRLSGRIFDLKKMGHSISKTMKKVPTRNGETRVAVYKLEADDGGTQNVLENDSSK